MNAKMENTTAMQMPIAIIHLVHTPVPVKLAFLEMGLVTVQVRFVNAQPYWWN